MDNYEEQSDFEINQQVAWALGCHTLPVVDGDIDVFIVPLDEPQIFDPCNKASDAWPIITENKIDIRHNYTEQGEDIAHKTALIGDDEDYMFWSSGDNLLRSAMIVFLKMEQDNEPTS